MNNLLDDLKTVVKILDKINRGMVNEGVSGRSQELVTYGNGGSDTLALLCLRLNKMGHDIEPPRPEDHYDENALQRRDH